MKVAVITGASRGIGLATVKKFLEEDWRVIGTSKSGRAAVNSTHFTNVKMDLGLPVSIENAAKEIAKLAGKIDVLVNNAGVILDALDMKAGLVKIRETLEIDLLGQIDLTERLIPHFNDSAHIINIASSYASLTDPIDDESSTGYRIAKAGLNMYTKTLAFRLKDDNITVSSLDPGWVKTEMGLATATAESGPDREPEEAAKDIYDLATEEYPATGRFWRFGNIRNW
jgi:NAD(P)-dependent dehydrogenase (short-subunit alcohol dehydrogenase family)